MKKTSTGRAWPTVNASPDERQASHLPGTHFGSGWDFSASVTEGWCAAALAPRTKPASQGVALVPSGGAVSISAPAPAASGYRRVAAWACAMLVAVSGICWVGTQLADVVQDLAEPYARAISREAGE
jgi:hypothetical protein